MVIGHSRNLVLRGAAGRLTENKIRNDMDHIHNLVITAVIAHGSDVFISTNSVGGAQFAQTCMRSRKEYKPFRIEWYPDECDDPLPQQSKAAPAPVRSPKTMVVPTNRFDLLEVDSDQDNSESEDESNGSSGVKIRVRSAATES